MIFGSSASVEGELLRLCSGGDIIACDTLRGNPNHYPQVSRRLPNWQPKPIYDTWLGRAYHDCVSGMDLMDPDSEKVVRELSNRCAGFHLSDEQRKSLEIPTIDGGTIPVRGVPSECKKLTDYIQTRCSSKARRPYYIGAIGLLALAGLGYWAWTKYKK